jgi:hypothetical protein
MVCCGLYQDRYGGLMMSLLLKFVGVSSMCIGLLMVAGSANDCDGKCMEQANTIEEMLLISLIGFVCMIGGYFIFKKGEQL